MCYLIPWYLKSSRKCCNDYIVLYAYKLDTFTILYEKIHERVSELLVCKISMSEIESSIHRKSVESVLAHNRYDNFQYSRLSSWSILGLWSSIFCNFYYYRTKWLVNSCLDHSRLLYEQQTSCKATRCKNILTLTHPQDVRWWWT